MNIFSFWCYILGHKGEIYVWANAHYFVCKRCGGVAYLDLKKVG